MAFTEYTESTDIILNLGTDPEDRPDLDDDGFKSKFDENATKIKTWLNDTHLPEVQAELDDKADEELTYTTVTASRDLAAADVGTCLDCTHASVAINITFQPHATIACPLKKPFYFRQGGAAAAAVVAGSGVTINQAKLKLNAQYSMACAIQVEEDVWDFFGDTKV
jgi:hypothetical protein